MGVQGHRALVWTKSQTESLLARPLFCIIVVASYAAEFQGPPFPLVFFSPYFLFHLSHTMGGGTSIWASPDYKKDPKEIFNRRLLLLAVTTACAGCAYGFDQGNIGGVLTFPAFRRTFGYDELSDEAADQREGVVAGMREFLSLSLSLVASSPWHLFLIFPLTISPPFSPFFPLSFSSCKARLSS